MFFFSLALFLAVSWTLPWWVSALAGLVLGLNRVPGWKDSLTFSSGAGLAWAALSYVQDGRNYGLISRRLAGMFSLPSPLLVYVVMGLLGFVTVFLCSQSGAAMRRMFLSQDETPPVNLDRTGT